MLSATLSDIVGPIVIGTTVVVGGAVLGYQAYSLGAEFAGKLMALPYFPSNRSALAMMLWEDAGKPMPESELHAVTSGVENALGATAENAHSFWQKLFGENALSKILELRAENADLAHGALHPGDLHAAFLGEEQ